MYNFPNAPGWALGYNIATSYNWKAKDSSKALTLPIGFTVGKTIALAGGYVPVQLEDDSPEDKIHT